MIRKAEKRDIAAIADTYTELLTYEQQHNNRSNWKPGVYPTIAVPEQKVPTGTMYVLEENKEICASMVLNHEQAEEYADIDWKYPGNNEEVLVIHTLCVSPQKSGRGYGRKMVEYAKTFAVTFVKRRITRA
ncbi:MAG: GNAT family N-acetyltransferase [Lachnospiraceae bacterium]